MEMYWDIDLFFVLGWCGLMGNGMLGKLKGGRLL